MNPDTRTTDTLASLEPVFAAKVRQVLAAMAALGYPMVAYDGRRTTEQQVKLYAQGRTAPGRIVTNADGVKKRSRHQDGVAVDCAFLQPKPGGWTLTWTGPWPAYGACGEALGLVWGGRFKSLQDLPHLETR